MVGKLRNEGMMIYENRTSSGVSYRVGTPSKAVIAAVKRHCSVLRLLSVTKIGDGEALLCRPLLQSVNQKVFYR